MNIGINGQFLCVPNPTGIHVMGRGLLNGLNEIDKKNNYFIYCDKTPDNLNFRLNSNYQLRVIKSFPLFSNTMWFHCQLAHAAYRDHIDVMIFFDHRSFLIWKPCKTFAT
ncbi:MAG: hypothetical protein GF384_04020, partial [Elusimicrobia bacterium]|nr:hypothetical protein [Elusimicrobiota bacterium]